MSSFQVGYNGTGRKLIKANAKKQYMLNPTRQAEANRQLCGSAKDMMDSHAHASGALQEAISLAERQNKIRIGVEISLEKVKTDLLYNRYHDCCFLLTTSLPVSCTAEHMTVGCN